VYGQQDVTTILKFKRALLQAEDAVFQEVVQISFLHGQSQFDETHFQGGVFVSRSFIYSYIYVHIYLISLFNMFAWVRFHYFVDKSHNRILKANADIYILMSQNNNVSGSMHVFCKNLTF